MHCPLSYALLKVKKTCFISVLNDLSIGSTETKYIKLNTKTQNIFCCVNENLMTFDRGDKKTEGEKKFSLLKCIKKSIVIKYKFGF